MTNGYGYKKLYRSITIRKEIFEELQEIAKDVGLNPNRPSKVIDYLIRVYYKYKSFEKSDQE